MPPMLMEHQSDPARVIWDAVGPVLKDIEVYGNKVLLGVYIRPNKTKSGIILADQTIAEDIHQGKVGLVLKKGRAAFVNDDRYDFRGQNVVEGDWIVIWVADGRKLMINGHLCRIVDDSQIRLRVPAPDVIF